MSTPRAARLLAWGAAGCVLVVAAASASFCVAYRAERRSSVVTIPDWTGKERMAAMAEARSLGLGFSVGDERHDPGVAADRVVAQDPAPGAVVRRGRSVRVTVSLGGETITIPSVIGHPARQAEAEIKRAGLAGGFEARIHDADAPEGQVLDQAPSGGSLGAAGEPVHRLISDGPRTPRWVMPDLTGRSLRDVQDWITLCGFRAGPARKVPGTGKAPGTVIGQLPLAGSPIARRDVVELSVAP
jgi:serine/threonine-protein kinase